MLQRNLFRPWFVIRGQNLLDKIPNPLMFARIENPLPVVETEWGTANNFGTYIEMHKDLIKHPELYNPILLHELSHTNKRFSFYDLSLDMNRSPDLRYRSLWIFMLNRPKTWVQLLPIYYRKDKGWIYDLNLTIIYIAISLITIVNIILWSIYFFG